ncbi:glucosaminidase domain-containing protein [Clostridium sp. JN-1]|jgi:hypothetical protein|uniref:glucosaminidase domain-containing protein n=1 Tax=Clostridium sp. JN-1 TaxID=2483110 RepID=UPI000F0B47D3|nr:glucosaminidase domain-containing protein [Clostridium sp. JN-1]
MNSFAENLKYIKVLDKNEVLVLRNYIYKKYVSNTKVENAKLLSNTVNHIIYSKLTGLPDKFKQSIKVNTLKSTFMNNKNSITILDILDSCLKDELLLNNFTSQLVTWVNLYTKNKINLDEFYSYLNTKNIKVNKSTAIADENPTNSSNTFNIKGNDSISRLKCNSHTIVLAISLILFVSLYIVTRFSPIQFTKVGYESRDILGINKQVQAYGEFSNLHLPKYMRYTNINEKKLKEFLNERNSLLASEPYFSTILNTSRKFNLNPILLFAITGQEQNFVPRSDSSCEKIANNPFNVYHSWQEYNTNIKDSSAIAARTVINLAKGMPKDSDPFLWIGQQYAEDKNWGNGVKSIFNELSSYVQ